MKNMHVPLKPLLYTPIISAIASEMDEEREWNWKVKLGVLGLVCHKWVETQNASHTVNIMKEHLADNCDCGCACMCVYAQRNESLCVTIVHRGWHKAWCHILSSSVRRIMRRQTCSNHVTCSSVTLKRMLTCFKQESLNMLEAQLLT